MLAELLAAGTLGPIDFTGQRVLVCAASRSERRLLAQYGAPAVVSVDIRPEAKPDLIVDITDMPQVTTASYDVIVASFVLCMTMEYRRAISEFARVLSAAGMLLTHDTMVEGKTVELELERITAWYGPENFTKYRIGHFRQFGLDDLKADLAFFFDSRDVSAADPITNRRVTWILNKKGDAA